MVEVPSKIYVTNLVKKAREAVRPLSLLTGPVKDRALLAMAEALDAHTERILEANEQDVDTVGKALQGEEDRDKVREAVERIRLAEQDIQTMAGTLRDLAQVSDPVGEVTGMWRRPNGLQVSRVRMPIGLLGIISDHGPKVTVESIALCLKSGNVCVMRAGSDWARTNSVVGQALLEAADKTGVPAGAISLIERPEREAALELLRMPKLVDAIIPRGGLPLRTVVMEQSRVPVLCHDGGVCSMYVDGEADLPLAQTLVVNGKVQQATAVNSVDTVLVHHGIARSLIPGLARRLLDDFKVDVKGCPKTVAMIGAQEFAQYKTVVAASEEDWSRQFVSTVLAVKVVKDMDEALDHIGRYGPSQTSTIVTRNYEAALRFTRAVDASAVLVNASTRFHEGPELGVGRAFGLSTSRLHARGPITLEDLTCQKYVVMGNGQLRQPHPVPTPYEDAIMLKRPS